MSLRHEDSSDTDEESPAQVETSVLLGIPDGDLETPAEAADVAVSRAGGLPAFLSSRAPPFSSSYCKICSNPSELLIQLWCPFENSPMDRALYVWGCARFACQGKEGSVRAWRGLRLNDAYAAKLARRQARQCTAVHNKEVRDPSKAIPFSVGRLSEEDLITAMTTVTLSESSWASAPSYPPLYLSTVAEYFPPQRRMKSLSGVHVTESSSEAPSSATEAYESSLEMDHVFEQFTKRVGCLGKQCVRYELNGTPLPYSSDKIFESLFTTSPARLLPVMKSEFIAALKPKHAYFPTTVATCPWCRSGRVFECQLMPNLINVLRQPENRTSSGNMSEADRRKALERALKLSSGNGTDSDRSMEWGTVMVFSCEQDCSIDDYGASTKECWREEVVLIQAAL